MELYNPDSVAGYPAYYQEPSFDRIWFSSNTLIGRYKLIESLIMGRNTITPNAKIYALDVSEDALKVAKENAELNTVEIEFIQADILNSSLLEDVALRQMGFKFDIIVS